MQGGPLPPLPVGFWQDRLIADVGRLLQGNDAVLTLAVFGSLAGSPTTADAWSDVDLLLVTAESARAQFFPDTAWLGSLGDIFATNRFSDRFRGTTRVCFTNFRRIDIVITTESGLLQVDDWPSIPFNGPMRVLFNRAPRLAPVLARHFARSSPALLSSDEFEAMVNDVWFKAVLAVTRVMRGDLLIAADLTWRLLSDCSVLGMYLRNRGEGTDHHGHRAIGDQLVTRLSDLQHPFTPDGLLTAIGETCSLFDDLALDWSHDYRPRGDALRGWITSARANVPPPAP